MTFAVAFAALSVVAWVALEWWVTRSIEILVVDEDSASPEPKLARFVVSDVGETFMVGIDTLGSEDRDALWEKLRPGCRYAVRAVD